MNSLSLRRLVFVFAVFFLVFAVGMWLFSPAPSPSRMKEPDADFEAIAKSYNWEQSRQNLEQIGRALQLYRSGYDVKPTSQRKTYSDAGVPPRLFRWAKDLGAPPSAWIVEDSRMFSPPPGGPETHYLFQFYGIPLGAPKLTDIWSKRGEAMPILLDMNMYSRGNMRQAVERKYPLKVLVLRLDGKVDATLFKPWDQSDFFTIR